MLPVGSARQIWRATTGAEPSSASKPPVRAPPERGPLQTTEAPTWAAIERGPRA